MNLLREVCITNLKTGYTVQEMKYYEGNTFLRENIHCVSQITWLNTQDPEKRKCYGRSNKELKNEIWKIIERMRTDHYKHSQVEGNHQKLLTEQPIKV